MNFSLWQRIRKIFHYDAVLKSSFVQAEKVEILIRPPLRPLITKFSIKTGIKVQ